jgi:general secretion pathway protein I
VKSKATAGFTLIETLLAVVILSSGILLLTSSWSGSFARMRKTQLNQEVAALLERKMAEIELEYRGKPLEGIPDEKEDAFGDEYPQYSWKMTSQDFKPPDLTAMMGGGGNDGVPQEMSMLANKLKEHLGKTIKEVKLTVIFTGGKRPVQYSIVTYFIDYNKQLSM